MALAVGAAPASVAVALATTAVRVAATSSADLAVGTAGDVAATLGPDEPRYPRAVLSRPMTYPAGMATAGVDVSSIAREVGGAADIRLVGGYGITDRFEVNFAHYEFATDHPGQGTFDFGLGAHLGGVLDDQIDLGLKVDSGYNLETSGLDPVQLGLTGQYSITPHFAVIWPGDQLQIGLDDAHAVSLALPLAVGYQVTPTLYLQLDTTLVSFGLSDAPTQVMFAHTTPVALTAFVSLVPTVDVFAGLSADLTPPDAPGTEGDTMANPQMTDTLNLLVGARYYFGRM